MPKAFLIKKRLSSQLRKKLFPGCSVFAYGERLEGRGFDHIVVAFLEETQREIEWVEEAQTYLLSGGKFVRLQ